MIHACNKSSETEFRKTVEDTVLVFRRPKSIQKSPLPPISLAQLCETSKIPPMRHKIFPPTVLRILSKETSWQMPGTYNHLCEVGTRKTCWKKSQEITLPQIKELCMSYVRPCRHATFGVEIHKLIYIKHTFVVKSSVVQ